MFKISSIAVLAFTSVAFAGEAIEPPAAESAAAPAATPAPTGETSAAPAPSGGLFGAAATTGEAPATPAAGETPVAIAAAPAAAAARDAVYGLAFRFRWISVPSWFLGMFTQKNVALSTYGYALEGFRRKRDRDDPNRTWEISAAIGYQGMSPSDGFWLGKGKELTQDTDLVQFRNFSLITMDAAFISRQYFSRYFGIHYGAGLGLAVVRGKILRTSAQCDPASGQCHVQIVQAGYQCGGPGQAACTEANLSGSSGQDNGPFDPHRFQETSVPGAVPIINLLFGLDFPIPDAKGLEFRVEGGFYDAFFIGGTAGYAF
jgi:hypothetical protein